MVKLVGIILITNRLTEMGKIIKAKQLEKRVTVDFAWYYIK